MAGQNLAYFPYFLFRYCKNVVAMTNTYTPFQPEQNHRHGICAGALTHLYIAISWIKIFCNPFAFYQSAGITCIKGNMFIKNSVVRFSTNMHITNAKRRYVWVTVLINFSRTEKASCLILRETTSTCIRIWKRWRKQSWQVSFRFILWLVRSSLI